MFFKTRTPTRWAPDWIEVSKQLPGEQQTVIVYAHPFPEPEVYVGWYSHHDGFWYVRGSRCRVTHWIPLPDPPMLGVEAQPA